jgi:glycerophosphoryl diester phosphodiesterase
MPENRPLVIGHRGASALEPENTMAAFERALSDGADGIELDVRLAIDGVPVVIHDANLRRTGRCEGNVAGMTSKELARTDVGRWFNAASSQYVEQCVPTLEQVFELLSRHDPAAVYLELKTDQQEESADRLADSVAKLIDEYEVGRKVVVVSFNLALIRQIKRIASDIRTGALFEPKREMARLARKQRMIEATIESGAGEILLHHLVATNGAVRLALENDLRVVVWTVDDPKWMSRARQRGIHALITNNPAAFTALP